MDYSFSLLLIFSFLAVVLLIEGIYTYWNDTRSPEVRRVAERLRAMSAGGHAQSESKLFKERVLSNTPGVQRLLLLLPRVHNLDKLLMQAGSKSTVSHLLAASAFLGLGGCAPGDRQGVKGASPKR